MNIKKILILATLALLFSQYPNMAQAGVLDSGEKLTVDLENVPVATAMNMIAKQYNLNIVVSGDVDATVSVKLKNVELKTALNAILLPNGYNFYINGDVIVVKSIKTRVIGEFVSKVITLNYIAPITARKALVVSKSEHGEIVILDKLSESSKDSKYQPNKILINDFPLVVESMLELLKDLDVKEKLISIEVRIIETLLDENNKIGFSWPSSVATALRAGTQNNSSVNNTTNTSGNTSNLNSALSKNLNAGGWTWGTLSVEQLQVVLDLLDQTQNSKLISDPRITTLENHEAEIKILTVIPIPTINRFSESASTTDILTFQDQEVGITLKVTPRINEFGEITMDVFPSVQDIIGFTGSEDSQKPITSERSIRTRITVKDGETATLGGLLKESEIIIERKVPLLGHIPFLGKILFTNKSKEKRMTDLTIFITPKILD